MIEMIPFRCQRVRFKLGYRFSKIVRGRDIVVCKDVEGWMLLKALQAIREAWIGGGNCCKGYDFHISVKKKGAELPSRAEGLFYLRPKNVRGRGEPVSRLGKKR